MKRFITQLVALALFQGTAFSQSCLPEGITFTTQEQIDSFKVNYPGCIEIEGYVSIHGPGITNLDSLEGLTVIEGALYITNTNLTNFNGLNNITSIGGIVVHYNPVLYDFEGLQSLGSIGGDFNVGYGTEAMFWGNISLHNFNGLDNLSSIGGSLFITDNEELNDLTGLESLTSLGGSLYIGAFWSDSIPQLTSIDALSNISAESIENLTIIHNISLSTCDVQSICNYLAAPNGTIEIYDNAPGCNTQQEVEEACGTGIPEENKTNLCTIFPNPLTSETTFSIDLNEPTQVNLVVMDWLGRVVATVLNESMGNGDHHITYNADGLPSGIYFYRLTTGSQSSTGKMVVVR